jgi:hypothetical protein
MLNEKVKRGPGSYRANACSDRQTGATNRITGFHLYVLYPCISSTMFSLLVDIRLQLLEPERYPHLFKCLYGLLMLLPQSSAFVSLRNRLNAVNSAGFLHIAPKS